MNIITEDIYFFRILIYNKNGCLNRIINIFENNFISIKSLGMQNIDSINSLAIINIVVDKKSVSNMDHLQAKLKAIIDIYHLDILVEEDIEISKQMGTFCLENSKETRLFLEQLKNQDIKMDVINERDSKILICFIGSVNKISELFTNIFSNKEIKVLDFNLGSVITNEKL